MPRDFLIETEPFTLKNGLLTGIRKLAWPKLKEHYGERLEALYAELAEDQAHELHALRQSGTGRPALETVSRAAAALLGTSTARLAPDTHFTDLGGDSLSALTFGNLLREIFDVDVPVGVIVSPASDLQSIAGYIEAERKGFQATDFRLGARPRRGRGARRRPDAGQIPRRRYAGPRADPARAFQRGPHRATDRRHRLFGPLPGTAMAAAARAGQRQADLPGARQVRDSAAVIRTAT